MDIVTLRFCKFIFIEITIIEIRDVFPFFCFCWMWTYVPPICVSNMCLQYGCSTFLRRADIFLPQLEGFSPPWQQFLQLLIFDLNVSDMKLWFLFLSQHPYPICYPMMISASIHPASLIVKEGHVTEMKCWKCLPSRNWEGLRVASIRTIVRKYQREQVS